MHDDPTTLPSDETVEWTRHQRDWIARHIADGWQEWAACTSADPDAWFPDPGEEPQTTKFARRICADCPVRRSCLLAALVSDEKGMWAGTRHGDRRRVWRKLKGGADVAETVTRVLDEAAWQANRRRAQAVVHEWRQQGCGTPSGYDGGCRCDQCRAASGQSRSAVA